MHCRPFLQRCCSGCLEAQTISWPSLEYEFEVPLDKFEGLRHYDWNENIPCFPG